MLGILAPLAVPQLDGLLIGLLVVAGCLVAIGLVHVARGFAVGVIGGIGHVLHYVPVIGGYIEQEIADFVHWLVSAFASAEAFLDGAMASFWRDATQLVQWLWSEISGGAALHHVTTQLLQGSITAGIGRKLGATVAERAGVIQGQVTATRAQLSAIGVELGHAAAGRVGAGIAAGVRPLAARIDRLEGRLTGQLGHVEHELGVAIPGEFGTLREWANHVTDELAAARARIAQLEAGTLTVAGTAAVAVALQRLGLEWTRCRNVGRLGRAFCGLPSSLLDGLLGLGVDALIAADLCHFAGLVEDVAVVLEPALDELVGLQNVLCLFGGASLPSAIVPADRRGRRGLPSAIVPADLTA